MAQVVAEWMTYGYPRVIDVHGADIARFYAEERGDDHIWSRAEESFNKTYGIVHPQEQWEDRRFLVTSPYLSRHEELGSVFFQARSWERPQWFDSNADLVERYGLEEREVEWDNRWWSPITTAEHLNLRENCGMVDLSAFQIYELSGPGAVECADHLAVNKIDVPVGRSIYTPWLTPDGGFHSDLTMMRTGEDRVRIVTGVFDGGRDEFWVKKHMPTDGSVTFENITMDVTTLGVWGPNAPVVVGQLTDLDLSQDGSPYGCSWIPRSQVCRAPSSGSRTWATPAGRSTRRGTTGRHCGMRSWRPDGTTDFGPRGRSVRQLRPFGEGLPTHGSGARVGVQPGRGRPGPSQGQGRRLHRQGGLPGRAPGRGRGRQCT